LTSTSYRLTWILSALLTLSAQAAVVWRGDFETGDRSQYYAAQMVSADRLAVVPSPVVQGKYALKVTVKNGDDPINSSGNRNELVYKGYEAAGSEYFYRWRTMFAADYPNYDSWALFAQWHHDSSAGGSPPISFYTVGNEIRLQVGGSSDQVVWTTPLVRGVWHDFVFHVRWAPDSRGFVELYYNGKLVLPKTYRANQFGSALNYFKIGLYRDSEIVPTGVVYHDDVVQATTLEDLIPPAPPPAPEPTPEPPAEPTPEPTENVDPVQAGAEAGADKTVVEPRTTSPVEDSNKTGLIAENRLGCSQSPVDAGMALLGGLFAIAAFGRTRRRKA